MNKRQVRHQKIQALLVERQLIGVRELAQILGCSEATLRNDLREMEKSSLIKRSHGGVLSNSEADSSHDEALEVQKNEKKAIAQYVVDHILKNNDTIVLDTGTTTLILAEYISKSSLELNIVTNSIETASILTKNKKLVIIVPGGEYDSHLDTLDTSESVEFYKKIHADYYFMTCNGIDPKDGFTVPYTKMIPIKQVIRNQVTSTIVLADSSKIGQVTTRKICGLNEVDMLIVDNGCTEIQKKSLLETDLDIRFAQMEKVGVYSQSMEL
ncbi:DeoR/GlpR family DNA-binding transcription regulator [Planomicrobium sp. CPCC 101110]|uniref:DeoR/GlpR family DNA-binding transcription regulator n=1 Tax=Planomicrobium sp. CPCC 101110 TaxID=2599619 RepID=UPI0011B51175|nr:DeoR/GlpR family DNA-binding transcription regulator [Planomicrobium sp. CPCC 101110]TWT25415.1 DeoR/GlpR transcriptional regulator [Planomicrobium sp. CPCC 101110]